MISIDSTQMVVLIVTVTLGTLLVILGIQVYFILKEIRTSMQKVNKMLDDAGKVTGTVGDSVVNLSGFMKGIQSGLSTISSLREKRKAE